MLDLLLKPALVEQAWDYFRNVQTKDDQVRAADPARGQAGDRDEQGHPGRACGRGDGRGLDRIPGRGRRITTGAGASRRSSWFWIPGRTWGPAWVSWAYAPGYVSWCPLGWNNRAVYGFYGGGYRGYNPWNAWTVVPHHGFGRGYVNLNVVNSTRIDVRTRNAFVVRDASPDVRGSCGAAIERADSLGRRARRTVEHGWRFSPRIARRAQEPRPRATGDAAAAFRSRRSAPATSNGTAYPAPAREPRSMSSLPAPARPSPARDAGAPTPETPVVFVAGRRARPTSGARSLVTSTHRRPRTFPHRRRDARRSTGPRRTPPRRTPAPGLTAYRSVPRSDRTGRSTDLYAPAAPYGGTPDRTYRSPSQDAPERSPRAMPRSVPDNNAPPAGSARRALVLLRAIARGRPRTKRACAVWPATTVRGARASIGTTVWVVRRRRITLAQRQGGGGQSSGRAVPRGGRG